MNPITIERTAPVTDRPPPPNCRRTILAATRDELHSSRSTSWRPSASSLMRGGGAGPVAALTSWQADAGLLVTAFLTILLLGATRAYDPATRLPGSRLRLSGQLALLGWSAAVMTALVSGGFAGTIETDRLVIASVGLTSAWVAARVLVAIAERRHPARTLVLGTGSTACHVWELSLRHRECAFEVVGFVDDEPLELPPGAPATLGQLAELPRLVAEHRIELVIVAYTRAVDADVVAMLRAVSGVRIQVIPRLYELVQARGFELGRIPYSKQGVSLPAPASTASSVRSTSSLRPFSCCCCLRCSSPSRSRSRSEMAGRSSFVNAAWASTVRCSTCSSSAP